MRSAGNWLARGIDGNSLPSIIMGLSCSFLLLKECGLGITITQFSIVENFYKKNIMDKKLHGVIV